MQITSDGTFYTISTSIPWQGGIGTLVSEAARVLDHLRKGMKSRKKPAKLFYLDGITKTNQALHLTYRGEETTLEDYYSRLAK